MHSRGASKKMNARQKEVAVLEQEDFDAGPTNLDCIEPGVWLGMYILNIKIHDSNALEACDPLKPFSKTSVFG
jgi:hypothetical protein